jgi:tetratricopeptide (TPR) repeat protein
MTRKSRFAITLVFLPLVYLGPASPPLAAQGAAAPAAEAPGSEAIVLRMRDLRLESSQLQLAGDLAAARRVAESAVALGEEAAAHSPEDLELLRALASSYDLLVEQLVQARELEAVRQKLGRVGEIRQLILPLAAKNPAVILETSLGFVSSGRALYRLDDLENARTVVGAGLKLAEMMAEANPRHATVLFTLIAALSAQAEIQKAADDRQGALASWSRALPLAEALVAQNPDQPEYLRGQHDAAHGLAVELEHAGDAAGARARYLLYLETADKLFAHRPPQAALLGLAALNRRLVGDSFSRDKDRKTAVQHYRRAIELSDALLAMDDSRENRRDLAEGLEKLGAALFLDRDHEAQVPVFARLLEERRALLATDPAARTARFELMRAHFWVYQQSREEKELDQALAIAATIEKEGPLLELESKLVGALRKAKESARAAAEAPAAGPGSR